jgi:hypothetical protein
VRQNAWLAVAVGAALVVLDVVVFAPPPTVRIDPAARLVGEPPPGDLDLSTSNPHAVQLRVTVREFPDVNMDVAAPDPETDAVGTVLSRPVVTTILGVNASVRQSIRLEGGDLEVDVHVEGTPRLRGTPGRSGVPPIALEHTLHVTSHRERFWSSAPQRRLHLQSQATAIDLEGRPQRTVFVVDGHLFALDLELHRAV